VILRPTAKRTAMMFSVGLRSNM